MLIYTRINIYTITDIKNKNIFFYIHVYRYTVVYNYTRVYMDNMYIYIYELNRYTRVYLLLITRVYLFNLKIGY